MKVLFIRVFVCVCVWTICAYFEKSCRSLGGCRFLHVWYEALWVQVYLLNKLTANFILNHLQLLSLKNRNKGRMTAFQQRKRGGLSSEQTEVCTEVWTGAVDGEHLGGGKNRRSNRAVWDFLWFENDKLAWMNSFCSFSTCLETWLMLICQGQRVIAAVYPVALHGYQSICIKQGGRPSSIRLSVFNLAKTKNIINVT